MVGKSAQMVEGEKSLPPMYKLHKRLFPVLLRLACDVDQVCAKDSYPRPHPICIGSINLQQYYNSGLNRNPEKLIDASLS